MEVYRGCLGSKPPPDESVPVVKGLVVKGLVVKSIKNTL